MLRDLAHVILGQIDAIHPGHLINLSVTKFNLLQVKCKRNVLEAFPEDFRCLNLSQNETVFFYKKEKINVSVIKVIRKIIGIAFASLNSVFHRILDFKTGLDFYSGPFSFICFSVISTIRLAKDFLNLSRKG